MSTARDEAITLLQRSALAVAMRRSAMDGREFEALKDYQPGMGRRMIDWKRSARHGKLPRASSGSRRTTISFWPSTAAG
ncbi:DUF58 domain-containing protein [Mesorhizobium atlanticum]